MTSPNYPEDFAFGSTVKAIVHGEEINGEIIGTPDEEMPEERFLLAVGGMHHFNNKDIAMEEVIIENNVTEVIEE